MTLAGLLVGERREFVWARSRRHMVANVGLFVGLLVVAGASYGLSRLGLTVVVLGFVGLIAILWRRHGRVVFAVDAITMYNAGFSRTLRSTDVQGYVWRAPQNFLPYGDGIVFVVENSTNGIGLRTLAPMMTASRLLSPKREAELVELIEEWHPGIVYYRTPDERRSSSPLIRERTGGVDVSRPPSRGRPQRRRPDDLGRL